MVILEALLVMPVMIGIDLRIQPDQSSLTLDFETSILNSGNLTGDHDPVNNPDGTITIPGLWGGSGNQEIPITFESGTRINGSSNPTGSFSVEPFDNQNLAIIQNLSMDFLGNTNIPASLTITLQYESFHTENPTSIYPGGVPIELPLAEVTLDSCIVEQTSSIAASWEQISENTFSLSGALPVQLTMEATYQAQPLPLGPVPAVLLINGDLEYTSNGASIQLSLSTSEGETVDLPGDDPLPSFPLSLPTLAPPGNVANVLMSLIPESTSFAMSLNGSITADAEPETPPCDVNDDGLVDANDVLAVLAAWGPCAGCDSDTNADGTVDVNDILVVLDCWSD